MGRHLLSLLIISFLFIDPQCFAQTSIQVSDPRLELRENILHIYYDIQNSDPSDKFEVSIDITNEYGDKISARTLSGDIGKDVVGGNKKHIYWNLASDHILMDQGFNIQIVCFKIITDEVTGTELDINRIGAIFRSTVFPGWGLSKIHHGQPHWIKGVAGYGCIAGSLVFNQKAHTSYQNYLDSYDSEERVAYYDNAVKQDQLSVALAYVAAGIWVTDIVWTILGSKDLSDKHSTTQLNGFSIGTDFEKNENVPLLTITYTF